MRLIGLVLTTLLIAPGKSSDGASSSRGVHPHGGVEAALLKLKEVELAYSRYRDVKSDRTEQVYIYKSWVEIRDCIRNGRVDPAYALDVLTNITEEALRLRIPMDPKPWFTPFCSVKKGGSG